MNLKNTIFFAIIILFIFQMMVMKQDAKNELTPNKPTIAASTFSLYDITKNVVGDSAEVFKILPDGLDVHSYEPTPKEAVKLHNSNLVVISGAGLEPWIDGFNFKSKVLDMSQHVELKESHHGHEHEDGEHENEEHEDEEDGCEHGVMDPHYWLDINNMIIATEYIAYELTKMFPKNKDLYTNNKNIYINMLKKLDKDYKNKLSTCKLNTVVVNHDAFSYLCENYGFEVEALSGLSPDAQPDAKTMIKLIEHVKEHNLKTIFFESFASDKAIQSIANEAKVGVDVISTLGNITADQADKNLSYEDIMRDNLEKLSSAMVCE